MAAEVLQTEALSDKKVWERTVMTRGRSSSTGAHGVDKSAWSWWERIPLQDSGTHRADSGLKSTELRQVKVGSIRVPPGSGSIGASQKTVGNSLVVSAYTLVLSGDALEASGQQSCDGDFHCNGREAVVQ